METGEGNVGSFTGHADLGLICGHANTSALKREKTSNAKTTKELSVGVVVTAPATYKDWDNNNAPSAAQTAKQADIDVIQAALHVKDYSIREDLSGAAKKKKSSSDPKSALKKKKTSTNTTKTQTTKEV